MTRTAPRLASALLFTAGLLFTTGPAFAQQTAYTGVCEDVFVPGYPEPEAPGTATEDLELIPIDLMHKAMEDCRKRASGFFKREDKAAMALVRNAAMGGDRKALPKLVEAAEHNVAEASYLIAYLYAMSPPVSPADPAYAELPRAMAEAHLRRAAEAGLPEAQFTLGRFLALGQIVKRDMAEARRWLAKLEERARRTKDTRHLVQTSLQLAAIALAADDPPTDDQARLPQLLEQMAADPQYDDLRARFRIRALRLGIGMPKDEAAARALAEAPGLLSKNTYIKAEYLLLLQSSEAAGDKARLAAELEQISPKGNFALGRIVGDMLYSGKPAGRDRQRALQFLAFPASDMQESAVSFARRAVESGFSVHVPPEALKRLYEAADLGLPGADVALIELLDSGKTDARDSASVTDLQVLYGARSDAMKLRGLNWIAQWGLNALYGPYLINEDAAAALDGFVAAKSAEAMRIKAVALRKGTLYRQDDVAATAMLVEAAEGGDVPAMLLLAEAYGSGKGIAENPGEEIRWIKAAVSAGAVAGERELVSELPFRRRYADFSVHDAMVTGLVLQGDGLTYSPIAPGYESVFLGPEIDRLGAGYIVSALMDGFRASIGLRRDDMIVSVFKQVPQAMTLKVEEVLKAEGFLAGPVDGFMGPAARTALAAWARARGLPAMEADAPPAAAAEDYRLADVPVIAPERIAALRERSFRAIRDARDEAAVKQATEVLQMLAQYGDVPSRLEILRAYAGSSTLKPSVVLGLVMLYGLDVLAADLPPEEKATIDFIFAATTMARYGAADNEADVILATLRDDPRFRDVAQFERIASQFVFVGGLCDALAGRAKANAIPGLDDDACSGTSRRALIAWAKAKGRDGSEAFMRREAAASLLKLPQ